MFVQLHRMSGRGGAGVAAIPARTMDFRYLRQCAHGILYLLRERLVIVTGQSNRRAKRDPHVSRPRHVPRAVKHAIDPFEPDRNDGHVQPRGDHPDAGEEAIDRACIRVMSLRDNQNGEPAVSGRSEVHVASVEPHEPPCEPQHP